MPLAGSLIYGLGGTPLGLIDSFDDAIDHVAAGLRRLPQQFKGKTNIEKLVSVLARPANDLEFAFLQLLLNRTVDNAVGTTLDLIGKVVGQARDGLADINYRRMIRARITRNRSKGLLTSVIRVTRLIIDDTEAGIEIVMKDAQIRVAITKKPIENDVADILIEFLKGTVSAGVRVVVESSTDESDTWFLWDVEDRGWDDGLFIDSRD